MSDFRPFIHGGMASVAAEIGTFPIDLTKTRLQIQGQRIDSNLAQIRYRGMFHGLYTIQREEGLLALYRGLSPAVLRQATYGTVRIGVYETLKKQYIMQFGDESVLGNVLCAMMSGVISSSLTNPTDVLKVRMQAGQRNLDAKGARLGLFRSFVNIYQLEGVRGLYRGVFPTAQRAALVTAVELPVFDAAKRILIKSAEMKDGAGTHFIASFIAGFAAAVASNPIDVMRTRLMNQRNLKDATAEQKQMIYKGTIDCFKQTVKHEGFMALYRGFIPLWLRLGPWNIIFFMTREQLKMHSSRE